MLQYNKKTIIHALALAPLPLLSLSALGVMTLNAEFNLYSIGVILLAHFLFYLLFYGLLIIPFAYIISYFLARKSRLNLMSIFISGTAIWILISHITRLFFVGSFPSPWWNIYKIYSFYLMILFTGFCYWLSLKWLSRKQIG
ncbi:MULTISPECIES: hypothetical protein [Acinetobacter]|uniref:hypothetical protein n=1 Tax=Acinetobacter TaxID=469 RepID=UPI00044790C7|nr:MULTISPECIES: hypothetical protein [Acinetobacter]EXR32913.1 putative membrane protein [Acinetobacter sp. 1179249]MBJ8464671.1 hypothetical protein [Acinetobacter nosocomialis]MBP1487951.1 hypothetical protein [Acinetobacter nosocomialis]MBP1498406.1 hypothetical protein [Acinetobacter nosocomialis]MCG9291356.1 hypothetical protein [Acinetobacter nosocomialis]